MSTHRIRRLEEEIKHMVSSLMVFEVTDPILRGITVTRVLITKDIGLARVYYDTPAGRTERLKIQEALEGAKGYFRKQIAPRLNLRMVPELEFFYDETKDEISRVEELFSKL